MKFAFQHLSAWKIARWIKQVKQPQKKDMMAQPKSGMAEIASNTDGRVI